MMISPYKILRVKPDATREEIDEAYYRMRRLISTSGIPEREIQKAYSILIDPARREMINVMLQRMTPRTAKAAASGGSWIQRLLKR